MKKIKRFLKQFNNKKKEAFYITTTLPYVNADPHIGFALEVVQADSLARFKRQELGKENVFFNTGTDEHGQKIFEAAEKAGKNTQDYVDHYAEQFGKLKSALNLSYDNFIRTTNPHHEKAAQEMWNRCRAKGDIYEKEFEGLYCVGCERYLTARDMEEGKCSIHQKEPEKRKERNWFFKLSNYDKQLLEYLNNTDVIIPEWRREEAIKFVEEGLEDFSISREKSKLSWGAPVPGDDTQVMYVWFDALTNYISTLGWPNEGGDFEKFWVEGETLQLAGKDQVRFQSLMWQAMLMSADIKNTDKIFYHGFINSGGQKMSKSLGNVISPYELVEKYGTDATRYILLRHVHSTEDTDVTWDKLDEWYEAGLSNGLGNLTARTMKLAETNLEKPVEIKEDRHETISKLVGEFEFQKIMEHVWKEIGGLDLYIQEEKPWESKDKEVIKTMVTNLSHIAYSLQSFMPDTAHEILGAIKENKMPEALFPRTD